VTPRAGPLRVLVVDDEPAILRFLHASLESQGYIVSTAANARTALDMVRNGAADLIVLDLGLPDVDGLDVVRQIRDGGETLPIIILSSRDNESAKVKAFDLGADDYVTKPLPLAQTVMQLRTAWIRKIVAPAFSKSMSAMASPGFLHPACAIQWGWHGSRKPALYGPW
jgi:two-component system, OmpR family, KDP operon response regulator KdpE